MAEVWGAAAGALISGYAAEKKAKAERKAANEDRRAATKEEAQYSAVLSQFEGQLDDYYSQLNRQRKQRGLDAFRQFSTVNKFNPAYSDSSRIALPEAPNVNTLIGMAVPDANKRIPTISEVFTNKAMGQDPLTPLGN